MDKKVIRRAAALAVVAFLISATAVFGIAWFLNATHMIAAATGSFGFRIDPLSGAFEIVYGELPGTFHKYGFAVIGVIGGLLIAHYLVNRRSWNPAGVRKPRRLQIAR